MVPLTVMGGESLLAARLIRRAALVTAALLLRAATSLAQPPCIGDCDRDGHITIDELLAGIGATLDAVPPACIAWDPDGDGTVLVSDLVRGVELALGGACAPAPPRLDGVLDLVLPGWEAACAITGSPSRINSIASTGEVSLSCQLSPGHEGRATLYRYAPGNAPAAFTYFSSSTRFADVSFRDLPARYAELPFTPGVLDGAERRLVWRLDCWVGIVSSLDEAPFRLAPDVFAASQTILDAAAAEMLAHCDY